MKVVHNFPKPRLRHGCFPKISQMFSEQLLIIITMCNFYSFHYPKADIPILRGGKSHPTADYKQKL